MCCYLKVENQKVGHYIPEVGQVTILLFIFYCQYVIQNTLHNSASVTQQTYTATVFKICINICIFFYSKLVNKFECPRCEVFSAKSGQQK